MGTRPRHALRRPETHTREEQVDLRTERLESSLQQQVLLEAVPTSALGDELPFEVLNRKRYRHPAVRIEVLERDRGDMCPMHLRGAGTPVQADPREIRVEVEHRGTLMEVAETASNQSAKSHRVPGQGW